MESGGSICDHCKNLFQFKPRCKCDESYLVNHTKHKVIVLVVIVVCDSDWRIASVLDCIIVFNNYFHRPTINIGNANAANIYIGAYSLIILNVIFYLFEKKSANRNAAIFELVQTGVLKMTDLKLTDLTLTDHITGHENAVHENNGPNDRAWNCRTWNCKTLTVLYVVSPL